MSPSGEMGGVVSLGRTVKVVLFCGLMAYCAFSALAEQRALAPVTVPMPDLVGKSMGDIVGITDEMFPDVVDRPKVLVPDLSPFQDGPQFSEFDAWTIARTVPAAGQPVVSTDEAVWLFVLKNDEWVWFQKNPVMPAVPVGADLESVVDDGPLKGAGRLVLTLGERGDGDAEYTDFFAGQEALVGHDDPSRELQSEYDERAGLALRNPRLVPLLTVRTIPAAGAPLRVGQRMAIVAQLKYVPVKLPAGGQGGAPGGDGGELDVGGGVGGSYSNDDHDHVNVPGWLCPTRFC